MAMGMCSDSDLHIRLHLSIYGLFTAAPMPHHVRGKMDKSERNNGGDAIDEKTEAADSKAGDGEQSRSGGKKAKVAQTPRCQVEKCTADLSKEYFRRHRVCELHAKARKVLLLGFEQRFCQQCSRFHALEEFDEAKRSCRRRLAGHNERRRKPPSDSSADRLDANSHHSNNWLTYGGV